FSLGAQKGASSIIRVSGLALEARLPRGDGCSRKHRPAVPVASSPGRARPASSVRRKSPNRREQEEEEEDEEEEEENEDEEEPRAARRSARGGAAAAARGRGPQAGHAQRQRAGEEPAAQAPGCTQACGKPEARPQARAQLRPGPPRQPGA
ncbi:unnamed protein product, partial [Prorocentrum cordatum]